MYWAEYSLVGDLKPSLKEDSLRGWGLEVNKWVYAGIARKRKI